jgi:hypothetical protein
MNWKTVRLELGRTSDFPEGSASRAYLLRVPLDDSGLIDAGALGREPGHATVRRFWPNQRDMSGRLVATPEGWAVRYDPGEAPPGNPATFRLDTRETMRLGACVTVTEPDGRALPFRVASLGRGA